MHSLDVSNWALSKLGQRPLASLDEDSVLATTCKMIFHALHRSLLRSWVWSFAKRNLVLSPLASKEGNEVIYTLPSKCLRVVKEDVDFVLRGDKLLIKDGGNDPLTITYVEEISIADCDPLYQEAITCKQACELCPLLNADSQLALRLHVEYEELKKSARDVDGIEFG